MTTPTTIGHAPDGLAGALRRHLARLLLFAASPEAGPARLGFLGAVLITAGGLGAGSTRLHDPLLESLHLSWLRFGHGLVLSSVLLWGGVALMLIACWVWAGGWSSGGPEHSNRGAFRNTRCWRPPGSGCFPCC